MPTQLLECGSSQIPQSGSEAACLKTASLLPTPPASLDLENNGKNPVDVLRLESHRSAPWPSPRAHALPCGECHFLTSAQKQAGAPGKQQHPQWQPQEAGVTPTLVL